VLDDHSPLGIDVRARDSDILIVVIRGVEETMSAFDLTLAVVVYGIVPYTGMWG